jgi:hypothetical protein
MTKLVNQKGKILVHTERKSSVRWFFDHIIVPRIQNKDFSIVFLGRALAQFGAFRECVKIVQQFMRILWSIYFNHGRALRERNVI